MNRREKAKLLRYLRREAWKRQHGRCLWCGVHMLKAVIEIAIRPMQAFTAEHLIPESKGGEDTTGNVVAACRGCNQRRENRSVEEWVSVLREGMHPQQFGLLLQRLAKLGISVDIGIPLPRPPTIEKHDCPEPPEE